MRDYRKAVGYLLRNMTDDLHPVYGGGRLSISEYDTAWLLRRQSKTTPNALMHPAALRWLLQNQHADGSWSQPYPHNILPTLSVVCALLSLPQPERKLAETALSSGIEFLKTHMATWQAASHESAGLEILLPRYLSELAQHGIHLSAQDQSEVAKQKKQKMARSAAAQYLLRGAPLVHSIEALVNDIDPAVLDSLRRADGNIANSVSATVAWLQSGHHDPDMEKWLDYVVERFNGLAPVVFPIDVLQTAWALLMLHPARDSIQQNEIAPLLRHLHKGLSEDGSAWCQHSAIAPDGDDTCASLTVLGLYDQPREPRQILKFEMNDRITSWMDERTSSVSVNAHALEAALVNLPTDYTQRIVDKTTAYMIANRAADGGYHDKWHLSRVYPAHCVIMALKRHPHAATRAEMKPSVAWLLQRQHADGGWGDEISSAEETALAVLALSGAYWESDLSGVIAKGKDWLDAHYDDPRPHKNIAKQLFTPDFIVEAEVLSAMLI